MKVAFGGAHVATRPSRSGACLEYNLSPLEFSNRPSLRADKERERVCRATSAVLHRVQPVNALRASNGFAFYRIRQREVFIRCAFRSIFSFRRSSMKYIYICRKRLLSETDRPSVIFVSFGRRR